MKKPFMYSNVICLAIAYVLLIVDPSWGSCFAAIGWTAAWYYHFEACRFIKELVDDGVIELTDE